MLDSTISFKSLILISFSVFITKSSLMPLDSSIAVITKIPSTSTENLTITLGIPAGLGSNPAKINSPSCVLFSDVSLSP